jgi:NAD-reducing hydrogenase large subunit
MKRLTIDPVSRIEGHAKISIHLNDEGRVSSTQLHITQTRGFEKFTEGRPFYEMPGITSRICGICPVSHLLASAKACDEILAVRIPATARKLRELLHCAQFVQSHALSFFYLSSPDLLLGMDSDPAKRNVVGVIEKFPELARLGIELRKFGLQIIEGLALERVHPSWVVPGGVNAPMSPQLRERIQSEMPGIMAGAERTISFFKGAIGSFQEEIDYFGSAPTMYAGMVGRKGNLQLYDGTLRFRDAAGAIVKDEIPAEE